VDETDLPDGLDRGAEEQDTLVPSADLPDQDGGVHLLGGERRLQRCHGSLARDQGQPVPGGADRVTGADQTEVQDIGIRLVVDARLDGHATRHGVEERQARLAGRHRAQVFLEDGEVERLGGTGNQHQIAALRLQTGGGLRQNLGAGLRASGHRLEVVDARRDAGGIGVRAMTQAAGYQSLFQVNVQRAALRGGLHDADARRARWPADGLGHDAHRWRRAGGRGEGWRGGHGWRWRRRRRRAAGHQQNQASQDQDYRRALRSPHRSPLLQIGVAFSILVLLANLTSGAGRDRRQQRPCCQGRCFQPADQAGGYCT